MSYSIKIKDSAAKALSRLAKDDRRRLIDTILVVRIGDRREVYR